MISEGSEHFCKVNVNSRVAVLAQSLLATICSSRFLVLTALRVHFHIKCQNYGDDDDDLLGLVYLYN